MMYRDKKTTVLLVSQPGIMHNTLYSILQSFVDALAVSTNGALTAFDHLEQQRTNVVVIDANLPLTERVALLARIKKQFPEVRTLVLTTTAKHHQRFKEAGADQILLQNASRQEIEAAVFAEKFEQGASEKLETEA